MNAILSAEVGSGQHSRPEPVEEVLARRALFIKMGRVVQTCASWVLRPAGEGRTLLSYALQIEVARYPAFLVRNIIMDRLHLVLSAVRDEVQRRRAARP